MKQQLVVAQLLPELNNGGVERGTIEIANYLAQKNCVSIVISSGGRLVDMLSPNVIHIELDVGKKSLFTLNMIKPLRNIFIQYNVNIVHARSRLPAWIALKAISKLKANKPSFITTVHGLYSVKRYSSIMARGDRVIAVSKTALEYVTRNYNKYLNNNPILIYRGVDPVEFPYRYKPSTKWLHEWRRQHPNLSNTKKVLLPGRLSSLKGAKDLLFWLKNTNENVKLILTSKISTNDYSQQLANYFSKHNVDKKIVWVGVQSSMAELYSMADVVVSTSKRPESFGRTVLEALAIGTPVVAYNHGGVGEILDKIFPQGKVYLNDETALANKIDQFLSQKYLVPNNNPFLLSTMLKKTLNVYKDVIYHD